jgi:hypothetical protein
VSFTSVGRPRKGGFSVARVSQQMANKKRITEDLLENPPEEEKNGTAA